MNKQIGRKLFKHLTQYERDRIENMRRNGIHAGDIAKTLARDKGTISRELKKHTNNTAAIKQHQHKKARTQRGKEASR